MGWPQAEWLAKAAELSNLYSADKAVAARHLRQHRHFVAVPQEPYDLVSLHAVISGLCGKPMTKGARSGQNLALLRPSLDAAGFTEIREGELGFEDVWKRYLSLCKEAGDVAPSGGPKMPPRQRNFFVLNSQSDFQRRVRTSSQDSQAARLTRLAKAPPLPEQRIATITTWVRNHDVVAEALFLAKGVCSDCRKDAPFLQRSDQSPFLEVHHIKPLSDGGEDTLENVKAICPNCHRKAHFG